MRGVILENHGPAETVKRAVNALSPGTWDKVQYCLESGRNGGDDPTRSTCASTWKHPKLGTVYTSDCVGFAMWCLGADRYQPKLFVPYGGWINTDAMLEDVRLTEISDMFELAAVPQPGDLVVYGGKKTVLGRKPGHVGVYIGNGQVVHCHGPTLKGRAVSKDPVTKWLDKGGRFVRFRR
jgi:cell wall-associated NlpC family hydrolase